VVDALAPYARVDRRTGRICVDAETGRCEWWPDTANDPKELGRQTSPPVWCGGDASYATASNDGPSAEQSQTTVESANDGKTAAYHIHEYLQVGAPVTRYRFEVGKPFEVKIIFRYANFKKYNACAHVLENEYGAKRRK